MNNYQVSKTAAGFFSLNRQQPHYADPAASPLRKMLARNKDKTETITLSHGQVKSHILVTPANDLRVVHIPFKTFDGEQDPDMDHPVVAGTIGNSCVANAPCYYTAANLSALFCLIKKADVTELGVQVGTHLTEPLVARNASSASGLIPEEAPFAVACYPLVLPKLIRVDIQEGYIFNEDVLESMKSYDEAAKLWLLAHRTYAEIP